MSSQLQGKPFYFDDLVVGAEHVAATHVVTAQAIIEFAQTWDPQPWHIDEAFAHIFSIFCITSQRWQSGVVQQVIAGLGFDQMRMHKPVYAGDTLRSLSIVETARLSKSKPDRGIVTYNTQLINQNDELVFSINASTLMARDPAK